MVAPDMIGAARIACDALGGGRWEGGVGRAICPICKRNSLVVVPHDDEVKFACILCTDQRAIHVAVLAMLGEAGVLESVTKPEY